VIGFVVQKKDNACSDSYTCTFDICLEK